MIVKTKMTMTMTAKMTTKTRMTTKTKITIRLVALYTGQDPSSNDLRMEDYVVSGSYLTEYISIGLEAPDHKL